MRELDFHIDEPIIHDVVIEGKMDFEAILTASNKPTGESLLNYGLIWTFAITFTAVLVMSLSLYNGSQTNVNLVAVVNQKSHVSKPLSTLDDGSFVIVPIDSVNASVVDLSKAKEGKVSSLAYSESREVHVDFKKKSELVKEVHKVKLESIDLPRAKIIESGKAQIIVEETVQIPKGFPISVDIKTYSDLKRCDFYYFELDKTKEDESVLKAEDWESGDLIFHPEKNKFNLILSKGPRKKQVVVRLIKG